MKQYKTFKDIEPSYVLLTKKETYKNFPTEELRSLFLEELQRAYKKQGGSSGLSYPTELIMSRDELIDCSIKYHKMLLDVIHTKGTPFDELLRPLCEHLAGRPQNELIGNLNYIIDNLNELGNNYTITLKTK